MSPPLPTQAELTRYVRAAIKGYQGATGRIATGAKVTFRAGEPIVEVTASAESSPPAPIQPGGGPNVASLKEELKKRHAARRL